MADCSRHGSDGALAISTLPHDRIINPTDEERQQVESAIDALLLTPGIQELVAAYFDPARPFAAATFDTLELGPPNRLTPADLLAVTFLDVRLKPRAVRLILGDDAELIEDILTNIPHELHLWDASDGHLAGALAAWDHLRSYDDVGEVIAGKLLARKRPRLTPVIDTVVRSVLRLAPNRAWTSLRAALQDAQRQQRIKDLQPPTASEDVTTLRLLDVGAWMRGSGSTAASVVRAEHCVPDALAP